jgi:O-antigen/teichoic acid export membrane protein
MDYYGYLDLGISKGLERYVSKYIGSNEKEKISVAVSTAFSIYLCIGILLLCISSIIALISGFFIGDPGKVFIFRVLVFILGMNMAMMFPLKVYSGIVHAHLHYEISALSVSSAMIIRAVLIFLFLSRGYGIIVLALITFSTNLLRYVFLLVFSLRRYPAYGVSVSKIRKFMAGLLLKYGLSSLFAQLGNLLKSKVDPFVITFYRGLGAVTPYHVGYCIIQYFQAFVVNTVGVIMPVLSRYDGAGNISLMKKRFINVTRIATLFSIFIGASILFYGKMFILRWMGPGFDKSYNVMAILTISFIIALMQSGSVTLMYSISKQKYFAVANICEGALNLCITLLLVPEYGIYGAAFGTAVSMFIFRFFIQPVYTCWILDLSFREFYFNVLFVTALKMLIPLLLFFYFVKGYLSSHYGVIFGLAVLQTMLFIPITFFFILTKEEKKILKSVVKIKRENK